MGWPCKKGIQCSAGTPPQYYGTQKPNPSHRFIPFESRTNMALISKTHDHEKGKSVHSWNTFAFMGYKVSAETWDFCLFEPQSNGTSSLMSPPALLCVVSNHCTLLHPASNDTVAAASSLDGSSCGFACGRVDVSGRAAFEKGSVKHPGA